MQTADLDPDLGAAVAVAAVAEPDQDLAAVDGADGGYGYVGAEEDGEGARIWTHQIVLVRLEEYTSWILGHVAAAEFAAVDGRQSPSVEHPGYQPWSVGAGFANDAEADGDGMSELAVEVHGLALGQQLQSVEYHGGDPGDPYHGQAYASPAVVLPFLVVDGVLPRARAHDGDHVVLVELAVVERGAAGWSNVVVTGSQVKLGRDDADSILEWS